MEAINIKKELGRRIKLLREEMNLTQDEFGKKVKIHKQQISDYERGENEPRQKTLDRIIEYSGTSPDYFKISDQPPTWKIETIQDKKFLDKVRKILESGNEKLVDLWKANTNNVYVAIYGSKNDDENKGGD